MNKEEEGPKEKDTIYTIEAGSSFYLFRKDTTDNLATAGESFKAVVVGKSSFGHGWLELVPLTDVKIPNVNFQTIGPRDVITWHPNIRR